MAKDKTSEVNFKAFDLEQLDDWYRKNLKRYEDDKGELNFGDDPNSEFYAKVELYERYLDARNKLLSRKPVETKQIVADEDAIASVKKTFNDINTKVQTCIANGVTLDSNDIRLLIEMMKVLNGDNK